IFGDVVEVSCRQDHKGAGGVGGLAVPVRAPAVVRAAAALPHALAPAERTLEPDERGNLRPVVRVTLAHFRADWQATLRGERLAASLLHCLIDALQESKARGYNLGVTDEHRGDAGT